MSDRFGQAWVETAMKPIAALRIDGRKNHGTKQNPDFRDPYNRIYEAVARCPNERTALSLVQAILDVHSKAIESIAGMAPLLKSDKAILHGWQVETPDGTYSLIECKITQLVDMPEEKQ